MSTQTDPRRDIDAELDLAMLALATATTPGGRRAAFERMRALKLEQARDPATVARLEAARGLSR